MQFYNCKVVDLGDYVKVIRYGKEINNTFPPKNKKESGKGNERNIKLKTRKLKNSEIENFIQLVYLNFSFGDQFVTLTYRERDLTLERGSRDFENWIKRLREKYGDFKYIAIRSFQKRGTLHYHVLISIPRLSEEELKSGGLKWEHGNSHTEKIYSLDVSYDKSLLVKYLVKNLKEFKADERSFNKRLFVKSKNLKEPEIAKGNYDEVLATINAQCPNLSLVEKSKFKTKYLGLMEVTIYKK